MNARSRDSGPRTVIYTIGHSTRGLDEFVALLQTHGITRLADVRSVPRSRRHPHFSAETLAVSLPKAGVAYRHFRALGGLRKLQRDSTNMAWRHEGFRGYADYMETPEFEAALDDLLAFATRPAGGVTPDRCGGDTSGSGSGTTRASAREGRGPRPHTCGSDA